MNRRELGKTLADKLSVTQAETMRFVQAWEETTTEALESDGSFDAIGLWDVLRLGTNRTGSAEILRMGWLI